MPGDHSAVSGDHGEFVQDLTESFEAPATEDGKSPPADVVSNPSLATTSATTEPAAAPDPDPDLENLDPTETSAPIPVTDPTSCAPIPSRCEPSAKEPLPDMPRQSGSTEGPL